MAKISIIVPAFNVEKYIGKCLDSLVNQTLKDIEIICINDCSTDDTLAIMQRYAETDERIRIIDLKENLRQGGARNRGIVCASSPYVAFVDSDDWVQEDMYEQLLDRAVSTHADIVTSDYYYYYGPTNIKVAVNCNPEIFGKSKEEQDKYFIVTGCRMWTSIFRKSLFIKNDLYYPEKCLYEDNPMLILYVLANKVEKINTPFYYYRNDNISTTRNINNPHFFDRLDTSKMFIDNFKRFNLYERYKEEVDYAFIKLYYWNTIWGGLNQFDPPAKQRISEVIESIRQLLPDYKENRYYKFLGSFKMRLFMDILNFCPTIGILVWNTYKKIKKASLRF